MLLANRVRANITLQITDSVINGIEMARTITQGVSGILEELELERPQLVTMKDIERLVSDAGIATPSAIVASRLRAAGWLLPTEFRGVWEFAPAELAGAYSSGDPLLSAKAFELAHPDAQPIVSLQAAAWALGLADRVPAKIDVVFPIIPRVKIPEGLRASAYAPNIATAKVKGARVLAPESIICHMVQRPSAVCSWQSAAEWIDDVAYELDAARMLEELGGRAASVRTRAGYLLQGMRPDIAAAIRKAGISKTKVRFGSNPAIRCDEDWMMVDCALPFDPKAKEALR